jgi:hypothetical protein
MSEVTIPGFAGYFSCKVCGYTPKEVAQYEDMERHLTTGAPAKDSAHWDLFNVDMSYVERRGHPR